MILANKVIYKLSILDPVSMYLRVRLISGKYKNCQPCSGWQFLFLFNSLWSIPVDNFIIFHLKILSDGGAGEVSE